MTGCKNGPGWKMYVLLKIGGFSTVYVSFFGGCTSYGNEAMLTAKWQITLLTIVVTHQIHSNSALFKNNAFEPIWWIQSCSNRSTLERSFKKTEWYLRTEMSWSCLGLIFWVYSTSIYFTRSNVVKSPNIISDVMMFPHLSIQIWLTSACIWHILTICISLKHSKNP